jgi:N-acetylmuramoyl-L-alanine amidase
MKDAAMQIRYIILVSMMLVTPAAAKTPIDCLALNIYHEARNQTILGQIAVGAVTYNRVKMDYFPDTVCAVVYQKHQFSWTELPKKKQIPYNPEAWFLARKIASFIIHGGYTDPAKGAVFYHTTKAKPSWRTAVNKVRKIGDHVFYSWNGKW